MFQRGSELVCFPKNTYQGKGGLGEEGFHKAKKHAFSTRVGCSLSIQFCASLGAARGLRASEEARRWGAGRGEYGGGCGLSLSLYLELLLEVGALRTLRATKVTFLSNSKLAQPDRLTSSV